MILKRATSLASFCCPFVLLVVAMVAICTFSTPARTIDALTPQSRDARDPGGWHNVGPSAPGCQRLWLPAGWLVRHIHRGEMSLTYIPDPGHMWQRG